MRPAYALALFLCAACSCSREPVGGNPFEACTEATSTSEQSYWIESADWADENTGLDLDGEHTTCDSGCINDAEGGIDNRFGLLLDGLSDSLGEDAMMRLFDVSHAISHGNLTWLMKTRSCELPGERSGLDAMFYNGVDLDGDPSDNASGTEEFNVTRTSIRPGGDDPVRHAAFSFDDGGEIHDDEHWLGPAEIVIFEWAVEGEVVRLPIRNVHLHLRQAPDRISGMLAGSALIEDLIQFVEPIALELDIEPRWVYAVMVNQRDMDIVQEGPTGQPCTSYDDCLLDWQTCRDDVCYEPPDEMDAISTALVFEAVPCTIAGIAEE